MSQTVGFFVTRGYSIGKIKKANIPVEDDEMEIGIDTYNDLIVQLQIDGITFGATIVTVKEDETDVPDWAQEMIKTQLALRLADEFGRAISALLVERADRAMRAVMRMVRIQRPSAMPNTLPRGSGNYDSSRSSRFFPDRDCGDIKSGNNDFMLDDEGQVIQDNTSCPGGNLSAIGDSNG